MEFFLFCLCWCSSVNRECTAKITRNNWLYDMSNEYPIQQQTSWFLLCFLVVARALSIYPFSSVPLTHRLADSLYSDVVVYIQFQIVFSLFIPFKRKVYIALHTNDIYTRIDWFDVKWQRENGLSKYSSKCDSNDNSSCGHPE